MDAEDTVPAPPPPPPLRIDVNAEPDVTPATSPSTLAEVDLSVLAELPAEVQEEVLATLRTEGSSTEVAQPMDMQITATSSSDSWECPMCTFLNHAALATCEICEFCILDFEDGTSDTVLPDAEAFRHAASAAKAKIMRVFKATNVKNEELLHSASAALHKVQASASKQLQQLSEKLSPRSDKHVSMSSRHAVPSSDVCLELSVLRTDLKTPCEPGDEVYESLLHHLWTALVDVTKATSFEREGEVWMTIGFQRINPDTDFRGGGLLALKCLVYVCHMHADKMVFLFRDQKPEPGKRWYPVCVAGINLTCLLAGLFKLGDGSFISTEAPYWPLFTEPNAFFEIYYLVLVKMDQIWHRSHATYMEFGDVLNATKKLVRYALAQSPMLSLADFAATVHAIHVDEFKITRRHEYFEDQEDLECPDPHHVLECDDDAESVKKTADRGIAGLHYTLQK
ncbi:hypothetical protein H310_11857 [Aphanomyces invadans]|uniref:ELMO domain-containing protein n=1 Tax=Aphanomyces invadans TaxID=157072 RepID=A0A024TKR2_9STRA|nr:hypothetical protein H310_11857 [Aphanomyces invadans]ETV94594.1 hypothetical protein H310_11857 [Aphanomyces invadans]|eukprot:XP_008876909.1 hypothetical protein H310_11857 [Aphanomyces invadans]